MRTDIQRPFFLLDCQIGVMSLAMYPYASGMLPWRDTQVYEALVKHLGVRLLYSEILTREATSEGEKLDAAQAAKLPATLLEDLWDAAILLDDRRCRQVVKRIDPVDGEFGARVRRMVNTFRYQELLAGLDPLVGSRSE